MYCLYIIYSITKQYTVVRVVVDQFNLKYIADQLNTSITHNVIILNLYNIIAKHHTLNTN